LSDLNLLFSHGAGNWTLVKGPHINSKRKPVASLGGAGADRTG